MESAPEYRDGIKSEDKHIVSALKEIKTEPVSVCRKTIFPPSQCVVLCCVVLCCCMMCIQTASQWQTPEFLDLELVFVLQRRYTEPQRSPIWQLGDLQHWWVSSATGGGSACGTKKGGNDESTFVGLNWVIVLFHVGGKKYMFYHPIIPFFKVCAHYLFCRQNVKKHSFFSL